MMSFTLTDNDNQSLRLNSSNFIPDFGLAEVSVLPVFLRSEGEGAGAVTLDVEVSTAQLNE